MTDEPAQDVPTGIELTTLDPAFRDDPYPVLARLHRREPVHYDSCPSSTSICPRPPPPP